MKTLLILCCSQSNGNSIWTLLFVSLFSVVVSIIGNSIVIRYGNIKKIKDEITETCNKLIFLNKTLCLFTALSRYNEFLKENNNTDKKFLESETVKFRDKFIDANNDKEFQLAKLLQLNHKLFSYFFEKDLARKIVAEINKLNKKDEETLYFIINLAKECAKDEAKLLTLHTDINKFILNGGNSKPLKEILALFNFIIASPSR